MEGYHTGTVHGGTLGRQELILEETRGEWVAAFHESDKSIATLPGETRSLPRIETLTGRAARGTYFVLLYPGSTMACNQDGVFFIQQSPEGPARTRIALTSCFPEELRRRARISTKSCRAVLPSPRHFGSGRHLDIRRTASGTGIALQFHQPALIGGSARSLDRKLGARPGTRHRQPKDPPPEPRAFFANLIDFAPPMSECRNQESAARGRGFSEAPSWLGFSTCASMCSGLESNAGQARAAHRCRCPRGRAPRRSRSGRRLRADLSDRRSRGGGGRVRRERHRLGRVGCESSDRHVHR